jgi:NCS2 family nucleobase:cation symporter-2/xanthine permease XanP
MFLAGIAGSPPVQSLASFSTALISLTGIASRRVGYAIALIFLSVALFPKFGAILLTIPGPVMGAYLIMALGIILVGGMQTVFRDGLDAQKSLVVGLAVSVGLGLNNHEIITILLGETLGAAFGSGVMYGAIVAVLLTFFLDRTGPRPRRLEAELDAAELPAIDGFLSGLASELEWDEPSGGRLRAAGEETLLSLLQRDDDEPLERAPSLVITARPEGGSVELEFVATTDRENLEDQLAYLSDEIRLPEANEISLRLLRHQASSVRHQKYHGIDIVTVLVEGSRRA